MTFDPVGNLDSVKFQIFFNVRMKMSKLCIEKCNYEEAFPLPTISLSSYFNSHKKQEKSRVQLFESAQRHSFDMYVCSKQ